MKNFVAILRGINVSGQKLIKMTELKKMFESLRFEDVNTYIQSGNIAFKTVPESAESLQDRIHESIQNTFHFDVPVTVLDEREIRDTQNGNPFLKERKEDGSKLYVTFLEKEPDEDLVKSLRATALFLPDEWVLSGRKVYVFCPEGYGKTKLNNNFFEKKLKVTATTRNWATVNALAELVGK